MELYRRQLGMIATAPLAGHGLGAFHDAHGPYKESPESHVPFHGESDWLETAVESGLLGWAARIRAASGVLAQRCVGRAMSEMRSYGNQGLYTGYLRPDKRQSGLKFKGKDWAFQQLVEARPGHLLWHEWFTAVARW